MDDLISRRQAIGALNDEYHGMISDESMKIYQIINWISALPSAQPERKIGKWIKVDSHIVICPFCKKASSPKNFCADCGADLRGGNNE